MSYEYYYQMPGGGVGGPLPLDTIRVAISAGRLPKGTLVRQGDNLPWITLESPAVVKLREMKAQADLTAKINSDLHPCPACGKEIYVAAKTCPHCGKTFMTLGRIVLLALLIIIIVWILGGWQMIGSAMKMNREMDKIEERARSMR